MPVKQRVGTVVSNKMQKTVVVAVENRKSHPKYGKIVARTKRYKAHDEENKCQQGDLVRITETRPLSRTKRWIVAEILSGKTIASTSAANNSQPKVESPEPATSSETVTNSPELAISSESTTDSSSSETVTDTEAVISPEAETES